tara:strand:- start:87606 stop:88961 length:1356 start_codon:yes stop_codon:yes gene_type:complete
MPAAFSAVLLSLALGSVEGNFASPNFVVHAPTTEIARQVAEAAEESRRKLALQWYGHEINNWGEPCEISVVVGKNLGAGGATRFKFDRGEVYGWKMEVQGSLERILDSVIPHEVNHTILACYFRRKVPRWADEGAATVVEHISEKSRSFDLAEKLVNQGRRIPLRVLLSMTQYPRDNDQVLAMYAQGYSLVEFLLQDKGRKHFLNFLNDAHHRGWDRAIATFYGSSGVEQLEQKWSSWVLAGSPRLDLPEGQLLASKENSARVAQADSVVRSQGPDVDTPAKPIWTAQQTQSSALPAVKSGPAALLSRVGQFSRNLTAPDPRGRVSSAPAVFEVAASSTTPQHAPVPNPREPINAVRRPDQPLQPLILTKIDDSTHSRTRQAVLIPTPLPSEIQSRLANDAAGKTGSKAVSMEMPPLRETRMRTTAPTKKPSPGKTADRFLNWSGFPTRVR